MRDESKTRLDDTGERMIPTGEGEVSVVFSRHQFTYRYAHQFADGKDVLDLGCGTGYGSAILAERANYVLGLDHDADAVAYSREHFTRPNVVFEQGDAAALALDREFDMAVSFQVIEHVRDTSAFIEGLKSAVKDQGLILISTPNVKTAHSGNGENPFHFSEMNYKQFEDLIDGKFKSYRILGVGRASRNLLRSMGQMIPFYRNIGLMFKRSSRIKKVAVQAMDLTRYRVIDENVVREAIDLLAVCTNNKTSP